jgi:hypothetical protein
MEPAEIIALIGLGSSLLTMAEKAVARGKMRGEYTPEQEAAIDQKLSEAKSLYYWQSSTAKP